MTDLPKVGDWVVVVVSDPSHPNGGAQPGQLCCLEQLFECALPFRVAWHDVGRGRRRYWWCQSVRLAMPEDIATHQLTSLPGGQL